MPALLAAASVLLSACTLPSAPGELGAHKVNVDGAPYLLSQLTASTWTATTAGMARPLVTSLSSRTALLEAIEKISGCKVTDSNYSRQSRQFDAQVDCGSKLKN